MRMEAKSAKTNEFYSLSAYYTESLGFLYVSNMKDYLDSFLNVYEDIIKNNEILKPYIVCDATSEFFIKIDVVNYDEELKESLQNEIKNLYFRIMITMNERKEN